MQTATTPHPADLLLRHLTDLATSTQRLLESWEEGDSIGEPIRDLADALTMAVGNLGEDTLGLGDEDET